jgi:hypothetical protein
MSRACGVIASPAVSDLELSADQIRSLLEEVANSLPRSDKPPTIIVVGGSLLAWHGLRAATKDIDSVRRLEESLKAAVSEVAKRYDLAPNWINDRAAAFMPANFEESTCVILVEHASLRVLGASFDDVFLMKLYASRATDYDDLAAIWRHCTFETPAEAVRRFYLAYPLEEHDEHLIDHIEGIQQAAR